VVHVFGQRICSWIVSCALFLALSCSLVFHKFSVFPYRALLRCVSTAFLGNAVVTRSTAIMQERHSPNRESNDGQSTSKNFDVFLRWYS
jgi:hypothetical protein